MKKRTLISVSLMALLFFLASCKKEPLVTPIPQPGGGQVPTAQKASFKFVTNLDLSGQSYHSSNLFAVVSIKNENNMEVIKDSVLQVNFGASVSTVALELPLGKYKLSNFRLEYGNVHTHFAAPISGSIKAAQILEPLELEFTVEKERVKNVMIEVLKVQNGDKPSDFGYPSGAFDHGQADAYPFLKIKMKAIMQIGDVLYDSIPASLTLKTWDSEGTMTTSYLSLKAGVNELSVLKAAIKYEFLVSKWGTTDKIILDRQNVNEGTVYILGGSKVAKKLKSELLYKLVNGNYVPETKIDYFYNATGNLSRIDHWSKKADNSNYLSQTEHFEYVGLKVGKITRYEEQGKKILTQTTFSYDNQGRIINMAQQENGMQTTAKVDYAQYTFPEIKVQYNFPGGMEMNAHGVYYNGNKITSYASKSNGDTEQGSYEYDFGINPYKHMNMPDFYLAHYSKNNLLIQRKQYFGSFPLHEPFSFNYTYDADGYPTAVIKNFKSNVGEPGFSTKTVYVY